MTIFSVTLSASRGIKRTLWKPQFPRLIVEIFLGVCYHFWRRITSSFQIWKNFQIWKLLVWKCIFHFRKKYFRTPLAVSRRIEWPLLKTTLPLQDGFCDKSFFSWRSNKTFKIRFGIVNFSPMIDGFYFLWYRHEFTDKPSGWMLKSSRPFFLSKIPKTVLFRNLPQFFQGHAAAMTHLLFQVHVQCTVLMCTCTETPERCGWKWIPLGLRLIPAVSDDTEVIEGPLNNFCRIRTWQLESLCC